MGEQYGKGVQAILVLELVHVVEDEHNRLAPRSQRRAELRETTRPQRAACGRERLEHGGLDRPVDVQRLGYVRQEDDGIVVAVVERDPGKLATAACRPLAEGCRLAVSRWRYDADEAMGMRAGEAVEEPGALDETRPGRWDVQLGPQKLQRLRLSLPDLGTRRRSAIYALLRRHRFSPSPTPPTTVCTSASRGNCVGLVTASRAG